MSSRYKSYLIKASVHINSEQLKFYYSVGKDLCEKQIDNKYGSKFYASLSRDLRKLLPDADGLTEDNLRYAKRFYQLYSDPKKLFPQVAEEFSANHILKRAEDNPTIGLLICKSKDRLLAQYALESSNQPIGISDFELEKLYPAKTEGLIPTIEEIEHGLIDNSQG